MPAYFIDIIKFRITLKFLSQTQKPDINHSFC